MRTAVMYVQNNMDAIVSCWYLNQESNFDLFALPSSKIKYNNDIVGYDVIYLIKTIASRNQIYKMCDKNKKVVIATNNYAAERLLNWKSKPDNLEVLQEHTRSATYAICCKLKCKTGKLLKCIDAINQKVDMPRADELLSYFSAFTLYDREKVDRLNNIVETNYDELYVRGSAVSDYKHGILDLALQKSTNVLFENHIALIANHDEDVSNAAILLSRNSTDGLGIIWRVVGVNIIQFTIKSTVGSGIVCEELAYKYGGIGHEFSAIFRLYDFNDLSKILESSYERQHSDKKIDVNDISNFIM